MVLTALTIVYILIAGLGMTFVLMRLVEQYPQSTADQTDQNRSTTIVEAAQKLEDTPTQVMPPKLPTMADGSDTDLIVQPAEQGDVP